MTCHEFRQAALPLTLRELSRSQGEQVWGHAGDCRPCGDWLQTQRTLASGLQALQSRTASLQAGPHVERALLEVFRQGPRKAAEPVAALGSTPVALRLSRFFEVGAYAAVAAAIVVGLFLGAQIWHDGAQGSHAQSQSASPVIAVAEPQGARSGQEAVSAEPQPNRSAPKAVTLQSHAKPTHRPSPVGENAANSGALDADYIALMFCDPLSCASDAQVVRMEIPGTSVAGSSEERTRIADVVVGYDGLVRAVRMVN